MTRLLPALALAAALIQSPQANAALHRLDNLFVFGDSLSDGGNSGLRSQQATGGAVVFPPFPYYNGQYSNGPVAVEYLWQMYNPGSTSFKPSLAGGTNYAIGGATSGLESYNSVNPNVPPFLQPAYNQYGNAWQLGQFAASNPAFDPTTSLFVVWFFPNDVFYADQTGNLPGTVPGSPGGSDVVSNGIANILTTVQTLAALGAQHFLVPNMPDLGATPEFRNTPGAPLLTGLSQLFNFNLGLALDALDASLPGEIVQFDTYRAFSDLMANPGAYGLTNTTESCVAILQQGGPCDPSRWLFWDGVHPTTTVHQILGAQFYSAVPEPASVALFALALFGLGTLRRSRAH